MTLNEAIKIFTKSEKCSTDDCPVTAGCDICPYNVSKEEYEEAIKMAITALKNFPTQMLGASDLVSRQYLLDEYDRQHQGPPGGARKIIEDAPSVEVPNNPANSSENPNSSELVSKKAVLAICMEKYWTIGGDDQYSISADGIYKKVKELPTIRFRPKVGYWKPVTMSEATGYDPDYSGDDQLYGYMCSECNTFAHENSEGEQLLTDYCPNCGAKMRW